jgi:hypothetical protein
MSTTFIIYPTTPAASLGRKARAAFMVSAFIHFVLAVALLLAVLAGFHFAGLGAILKEQVDALAHGWLYASGAVFAIGLASTRIARISTSKPAQYAAYVLFVLLHAVVAAPFVALLAEAAPAMPACAASLLMAGAVALAGITLAFREEYKAGRAMALWCAAAAAIAGLCCFLFGFEPATYVAAGAALLAGIAVLYDTRLMLEEYPRERYVSAALELFAAIPLFPWYILRAIFVAHR